MATSEGKKLRSVSPSPLGAAASSAFIPSGNLPLRSFGKPARIPRLELPPSQAELFDYRYLTGRSSARIALFEIEALVPVRGEDGNLADQFWRSTSRLIDGNETFCAAYGSPDARAFLGKPFEFFFPPTAQHRAMIEQWVHHGLVLGHFDLQMLALTGETKSFSVAMYAVDERSAVRRFWIVLRDVTPLANALREVSRQERHYRQLVEGSGFFVVRVDAHGAPLYLSPALEELVGFPAAEFEANPHLYRSLIHPDDVENHETILQARAGSGARVTEAEYRILCRDGTYRWLFERQTRAERPPGDSEAPDQIYFDSLLFDIQDRKTLEAEVRHAQRMDMVGQLAGGVAHDFNNYLTAILGQIRLSLLEVPPGSATQQRLLATEEATLRCSEMTKQLLTLSRRDGLNKHPLKIPRLLSSTAALCSHLLPSSVCLSTQVDAPELWIEGDEGQLQQVLMNLVVNARDAIHGPGSIRLSLARRVLTAENTVHSLSPGAYTEIKVSDSGCGIAPEMLHHIFEPFFTTKPAGQGTGLGLSLVYSIVRNHGGAVQVESQVGVGTTFTILLPLLAHSAESCAPIPENSQAPPLAAEPAEPMVGSEHAEVLIVDDEPLVRSVVKAALLGSGYRVTEAANGGDALSLILRDPTRFSLIVIDQTMPVLSGKELVQRIRAAKIQTPLLLTTGLSSFDGAPVHDPNVEVITKPFDPIELIGAAFRLCAKAE